LPSSTNYNVFQGQRRRFNQQGKQSIKCNTGWVSEDYFELIQDLLLSEVVLLDNVPVNVKTKSSEKKTHLNNRLINYEIDFEYNFGLINDVI
jgi:3-phosphoglycerate kinase